MTKSITTKRSLHFHSVLATFRGWASQSSERWNYFVVLKIVKEKEEGRGATNVQLFLKTDS